MTAFLVSLCLAGPHPSAYVAAERKWRADEERSLRKETGWLSVAGLHWLKEGVSTVGSAPQSDVRIAGVPPVLGTVSLVDGKVWFEARPEAKVTVDALPARGLTPLRSDDEKKPSRLRVGEETIAVIRRGKRTGFRVYDPETPRRLAFRGLRWFPIDPAYRITARFVRYPKPKTLMITNVIGDVRAAPCPGYAEFRVGGRTVRLDAEDQGDTYFFNFRDATSNRETYGAGRFLDAAKAKDGRIVLDFNRATNPPCAFTDFATCPLPPMQNTLSVPIRAGALNGHRE